MEKPIHVLHVLSCVWLGGAESRIMDLYRQMDRTEIQFDFLVHSSAVKNGFREVRQGDGALQAGKDGSGSVRKPQFYDEEILSMGGRIYVLPKFKAFIHKFIIFFPTKRPSKLFLRRTGSFAWCRAI